MSAVVRQMIKDRALPDDCDSWGFRLNQAGGESRHGFVWPREGWVEAPGPIADDNNGACPVLPGDGICAAIDWHGVFATYRVGEVALLAWNDRDVLGSEFGKVRLRRAYVAAVLPLRETDLSEANLRDIDMVGADLRGANLHGAELSQAYLCGADLRGANLRYANLVEADLSGADLRGANLSDAYLYGADLRGANLVDTDLSGAQLGDADLSGAKLGDADWSD